MSYQIKTQIFLRREQRNVLDMIAANEGRSLSEVVRELLDTQLQQRRHTQMAEAARILKDDYENNAALTEFTVLDGEEFSNS